MNQLIIAPPIGEAPTIAITEEGEQRKVSLLDHASKIPVVTDEIGRDHTLVIAGNIKAHIAAVEKTRVAIKEPFLVTGRAIDAAAKAHVTALESELKRLNGLIGNFETERRHAEAARQRALAEEQARQAREAEKARLEALRIAEEARKKEEAAAAKGKELSEAAQQKIVEARMEAAEKQEQIEAEQRRLESERAAAAQRAAEAKPTGGALKTETDITVTDIHALYAACRDAVRMEPDKAFLKLAHTRGIDYPGVSYTERQVFATRAR